MNSHAHCPETTDALNRCERPERSSLDVVARLFAVLAAAVALVVVVGVLAATVPAVGVALGVLAAAVAVVALVAFPVVVVQAVGESL